MNIVRCIVDNLVLNMQTILQLFTILGLGITIGVYKKQVEILSRKIEEIDKEYSHHYEQILQKILEIEKKIIVLEEIIKNR